MWLTLRPGVDP